MMEIIGEILGCSLIGGFYYAFIIKPIYLDKGASDEEKKWMFVVWILPPILVLLFIIFN